MIRFLSNYILINDQLLIDLLLNNKNINLLLKVLKEKSPNIKLELCLLISNLIRISSLTLIQSLILPEILESLIDCLDLEDFFIIESIILTFSKLFQIDISLGNENIKEIFNKFDLLNKIENLINHENLQIKEISNLFYIKFFKKEIQINRIPFNFKLNKSLFIKE